MMAVTKMNRARLAQQSGLHFWIGPIGCTIVGTLIILVALILPSQTYSILIGGEPNLMHLNRDVFIFVLACALAFCLGAAPFRGSEEKPRNHVSTHPAFIITIVTGCMILNAYSLLKILSNTPDLLSAIASGQGSKGKDMLNTVGALTEALPLLCAATWWASVEYHLSTKRGLWFFLRLLLWLSSSMVLFTAAAKLARFEMIPFLFGMMLIYLRFGTKAETRAAASIPLIIAFSALILFIFSIFSALRGSDSISEQIKMILGYGPASVNRLAALLMGRLDYPYAGTGAYMASFASHVPFLHSFIDFNHLLGLPTRLAVFKSEFNAVKAAGLDPTFIWLTAWGYYYADIGWGVLVWALGLGVASGAAWRSFTRGGAFGAALYPFLATSALLAISFNMVTQPRLITYLAASSLFVVANWVTRIAAQLSATSGTHFAVRGVQASPLTARPGRWSVRKR